MLSFAKEYYQVFLSQGICIGLGGGLLYVPSLALISHSFKDKRELAFSIVTCGIGLGMFLPPLTPREGDSCSGGVIYTAAFQSLLPQLGFPQTVRALAFIALGVFALSIPTLILTSPPKPRQATTQRRKLFDAQALRDLPFLAYSLSSFLIFLGYLIPFFYIPTFAQTALGSSRSLSFWALAVSSATSIFGRLSAGYVARKFGVMIPWIACSTISGALCLAWAGVKTMPAFFAFCGLYGTSISESHSLPRPQISAKGMCSDML